MTRSFNNTSWSVSQSPLKSTFRLIFTAILLSLVSTTYASTFTSYHDFLSYHGKPVLDRDHDNRVYFAAEILDFDLEDWAARFSNWTYEQPIGYLENHYLFSVPKNCIDQEHQYGAEDSLAFHEPHFKRHLAQNNINVKHFEFLPTKKLVKKAPVGLAEPPLDSAFKVVQEVKDKLHIEDPGFIKQWHLVNPMQPGNDLNVTGVWYQGNMGQNSTVAVVDDGIDMDHEDLKNNYFAEGSWDFNDNGPNPRPKLKDDRHGTRCCGEIAAVKNNDCGIGVAYQARIAGLRILSGFVTDADEAIALNYAMDKNDIYSCSWGPPDNGKAMDAPGTLVRKSLLNGVQNGRQERGSVFVFASGNGASHGDNCNFDGYTNSIYSITVAAIDRENKHPYYSEPCSANLVVTYSSGNADHIYTTDVHGGCTNSHGGTSAAAPIAAGVYALVLTARPELTWRDLQYLTWDTAVPFNENEDGWQTTPSGKRFHHKYGYGKLDAYSIVERAKTWELVKPQAWWFSDRNVVEQPISYSQDKQKGGVFSVITVTEDDLKNANVERLEHVNVLMNVDFTIRGALSIYLESPEGVISELAPPRHLDESTSGIKDWTFMSVVHWGESGVGNWTIHVYNSENDKASGKFVDWTLKLWGVAKDASKARLYEFEEEKKVPQKPVPQTSTIEPVHISTSTSIADSAATSTSTSIAISSSTNGPQPTQTNPEPVTTNSPENATATPHHSIFPTFGLSGKHLAWVYGSFVLIALFVVSLAVYICIYRRRKRNQQFKRLPLDSGYEFELVPAGETHDESQSFLGSELDEELSDISADDEHAVDEETRRLRYDFYHGDGRAPAERDELDQSSSTETSTGSHTGVTVGQKARSLYDGKMTKSQQDLKADKKKDKDREDDTDSSTVLFAVDSEEE